MFTGGVCQLWAVIDSKGFTRRVSWGRCRVCYHWPITCLLAGRGSGTLKAWSTDTFTLRTFVFQFRECQVHVCLFSRGNWVSLFWMRVQYLHVPALSAYSWTLTAPPSLWERGLLKLDQNMPAVVAASELPPFPGRTWGSFKRRRPACLWWAGREDNTEGQKQVAWGLRTLWSWDHLQFSCPGMPARVGDTPQVFFSSLIPLL